jgi:hypothetical protein
MPVSRFEIFSIGGVGSPIQRQMIITTHLPIVKRNLQLGVWEQVVNEISRKGAKPPRESFFLCVFAALRESFFVQSDNLFVHPTIG